jgi:hypothetical protein
MGNSERRMVDGEIASLSDFKIIFNDLIALEAKTFDVMGIP